ncbi:uncharacterized protein perm1b [Notothenia coriiceps]|uniref:Uncharacterized protein perm1b n=1 Tax=Notothenia coriiceps TaxID=8208 RepID=A0A6I9MPV5_9TELE|nr:PREDICTED: uncharacterized protein LOC104941843 [Notothenia coriiceps]
MDDLDHSIHIANDDWTSFYEECEGCGLVQPSLACPDSWSLSDSEELGNPSSVSSAGHQEPEHSCAASSDGAEGSAAGCCMEEENCTDGVKSVSVQVVQCGSAGETKAEAGRGNPEENAFNTAEHIEEEKHANIKTTLQIEQLNVQCSEGESSELKRGDEAVQIETDIHGLISTQQPDPISYNLTELDGSVSEDVSGLRAEKERWFVTVNESPARQGVRAASVKKKRRQKKTRKERSLENHYRLEKTKDNNESEVERNLVKKCAETDSESVPMGVISDSSQMSLTSDEEDNLSEQLVMSPSPQDNIIEPTVEFKSNNRITPRKPIKLDSVESDVYEDGVEFYSTHSFDSESYLSATESWEDLQHLLKEHQQLQRSLSLTENSYLFNLTEITEADNTQDREMLSYDVPASNCEGHESTDVQPSAGQSADRMPEDISTCDNQTHSTLPAPTPGLQKQEVNHLASGGSSVNQLLPIPDLTVTPCSVADSPETYAEAAGHTRPVYAISAFWDEMEKLTINDILQLRVGRSTPPRDTVTPNADGPLLDTVEYNLSDGVLMDTSDTADSDYFTQPDESKRDRSSCEFSTSDFEEEYWQYLSASRNQSPDPQSKSQQSPGDSPFTAYEKEESLSSETPVPLEDYAEDQEASDFLLSRLGLPRPITKSKSLQNLSAFKTEDLSLQLLLGKDESSLFLSSCPSLEENVVLTASDSLGTQIPTSLLGEHDQISLPEVFEYLYSDDRTNGDSQCVKVYDPVDISMVYDYSLCAFSDEMSFSFLYNFPRSEEKPIPIFSCSQPLIRELTFPNPDFVFLRSDFEEEGDISPFRIMSSSFFKRDDCGVSASNGFYNWKSLMRKVRFPDKGSIWCSRSGATVFPDEVEKITTKSADPPLTVLTARRGSSSPFLLFSELALQKRVLDALQATRQEGIFSSLKQSDMCMVCIAFASWVLKSSDPESADAWKAALLANVSALSAIQYLRQYVKRRNPS